MMRAEIFWTENGQAVHLPETFQFPTGMNEVEIHWERDRLVLSPISPEPWPEEFWQAFDGMSEDFERPPQV